MEYVLLVIVTLAISMQSVFQKQYHVKAKTPAPFLFLALSSLTALLFFVFTSGFHFHWDAAMLPYSIGFGLAYLSSLLGTFYAVQCGSLAITMLVISYSLVIPTLYGILFLHDSIGPLVYIGILLLLVSLFLINVKKGEAAFSLKWFLFVLLGFVSNGMCSTVQKMQQVRFDGDGKSEFMILALVVATICLTVLACRKGFSLASLKECAPYSLLNGISNGIVNLLIMILTGLIASAVLFPTISAGGIVISFLFAILVYKERLSKNQLIGYGMGIAAVILLNL